MAEYRRDVISYLKCKYHVWRAERLLRKIAKMREQIEKLQEDAVKYTKRAREIIEDVKW